MRVIAGKHRSRKLRMVDDQSTRETKDRVKESVFNMIGPYQVMDRVLDLFAGSGALGIEACSRGAKDLVFVDQSTKAIDVIKHNIDELSIKSCSTVILMDAFDYLRSAKGQFELIFLDPPYHQVSLEACLSLIQEKNLLSQDGLIVVFTDQSTNLQNLSGFEILKEKRITRTKVLFLKG